MALYNLKNPYDRQKFKEKVNQLELKQEYVELKVKHTNRTLAQNSYLHLLLGYFASEFGYTLDEVKMDFYKRKCNPDIYVVERVNRRGRTVKTLRSSTDLDKLEMTRSIERFRNWSASECGLYLPSANEAEAIFHAQQQVEQYQNYK
jgi:hypothetical protein